MKNSPNDIAAVRKVLHQSLGEGGKILRRGFGQKHSVKWKGPISIVTEIDLAAEKKIVSLIRKKFPLHSIVTEESAPQVQPSPWRWIIDPLDGTTNYAHGINICAVSIGVEYDGHMVLGGVYNPLQNELFWAERGQGATLNGKTIRVSSVNKLINSLTVTGFPYDRDEKAAYNLLFVREMLARTQGMRRLGAAAVDLAYVACGRLEVFWEFHLQSWDVAAGVLIVEEAGGRVTDASGAVMNIRHPQALLATNGLLHNEVLRHFKKVMAAARPR